MTNAELPLLAAKERLAQRALLMMGFLLPAVLIGFWMTREPWLYIPTLTLVFACVAAGLLPASFSVRRAILLASLGSYTFSLGLPAWGFGPGPMSTATLLCVYATLLGGRHLGFGVTCATTLGLLGFGIAHLAKAPILQAVYQGADPTARLARDAFALLSLLLVPLPPILSFLTELQGTARSKAEALDRTIAEELKRDDALRAHRVTQDELRGAQRERTLGRMAGGLAHEINSVLQEIEGWIEVLTNEDSTTQETNEAVSEMRDSVRRAAAVGRRLLYVGGQNLSAARPTDLDDYLERVRPTLVAAAGPRVELIIQSMRCPPILADPTELTHAVVNLIVNARDAIKGQGRIVVSTEPIRLSSASNGDTELSAVLSVRDDGPGIDEDVLEHVFEPFFTTKGKNGSGLGLATVRRLIEGAGGQVKIDSAVGEGTKVSLFLPAVRGGTASTAPPPSYSSALRPRSNVESANPVVLFVEDQAAIRQVFLRVIPKSGIDLIEADSVDSALSILEKIEPDLIWSDAIMPGRPVQDLIEAAKGKGIPIVICSGHVEEELLRRDLRGSDIEFVPKPYSARQLIARARSAQAERRAEHRSSASRLVVEPLRANSLHPATPVGPQAIHPPALSPSEDREEAAAFTVRSLSTTESNPRPSALLSLSPTSRSPTSRPRPLRVLLADDDPSVLRSLRRGLERFGFAVISANDGIEAEALYTTEQPIDIVVLDANMPRRGGPETAVALLQVDPDARIVLCSGNATDTFEVRGVLDVLPKPIGLQDLAERLRALCAPRYARSATR